MVLYATIVLAKHDFPNPIHLGCFHHQMLWDSRFPKEFADIGKPTLEGMRREHKTVDPTEAGQFILGGDGWGTPWCDDIGIPAMHDYQGGDWICARGFKPSNFVRMPAREVSDHDMFSVTLWGAHVTMWVSLSICLDNIGNNQDDNISRLGKQDSRCMSSS